MEIRIRFSALTSFVDVGFTEISLIIPECKLFTVLMNRLASSRFSVENSDEMKQKEEASTSSGEIHWFMVDSASSRLSSIRDSKKLWCECCFSLEEEEEVVDKAKSTIFVFFCVNDFV